MPVFAFFEDAGMGSAAVQGDLWGQAPSDWTFIQEPHHNPIFEAMIDAA
jgi:hypothetical protein